MEIHECGFNVTIYAINPLNQCLVWQSILMILWSSKHDFLFFKTELPSIENWRFLSFFHPFKNLTQVLFNELISHHFLCDSHLTRHHLFVRLLAVSIDLSLKFVMVTYENSLVLRSLFL